MLLLTDLTHAIKGPVVNLYTIAHKKSTPEVRQRCATKITAVSQNLDWSLHDQGDT